MKTKYTAAIFLYVCLFLLVVPSFAPKAKTGVVSSGEDGSLHLKKSIEEADSGDIIYLKPGVYRGNFSVNKDLTIIGRTWKETVIEGGSEIRSVLSVGPDDVKVRLVGVSIKYGCRQGIQVTGHSFLEMKRCKIEKNGYHGLEGSGSSRIEIKNSTFVGNGWSGIKLQESATATVKGSKFRLNQWTAVSLSGTSGVLITNSEVVNNLDGINLWDSSWASVNGSTLVKNFFAISPNDSSVVDIEENTIKNNSYSVAPKDPKYRSSDSKSEYEGKIMGDSNRITENVEPMRPKELKFLRTSLGGEYGTRPRIPQRLETE